MCNERLCKVGNRTALFHRWSEEDKILLNGHGEYKTTIKGTVGIVEFIDGTIKKCDPEEVRFIDGLADLLGRGY